MTEVWFSLARWTHKCRKIHNSSTWEPFMMLALSKSRNIFNWIGNLVEVSNITKKLQNENLLRNNSYIEKRNHNQVKMVMSSSRDCFYISLHIKLMYSCGYLLNVVILIIIFEFWSHLIIFVVFVWNTVVCYVDMYNLSFTELWFWKT